MDLVIQNTLQMSSAGTALGSRPHGSTAREAKSKRENAGQLSQETAAGADPTQGRLLGHLGWPSWGLLSCYLSFVEEGGEGAPYCPEHQQDLDRRSEWTRVRKQTSLNLACPMPTGITQTAGKSRRGKTTSGSHTGKAPASPDPHQAC